MGSVTFEQAMLEALEAPRYYYLTGRFDEVGNIFSRFRDRIVGFLLRLFDREFAGFGSGVNTDVLSGIFIAVAAFIVILTIMLFVRMFLKYRRKNRKGSREIFEDYRNNRLSYDEIMALVKKHDSEQNTKEAVRYRYIGMIMLFNANEIVSVTDSMTGNQFEREAARSMPSLQNGVRNTINMYYNLFFGHKSVSHDDYEKYLYAYDTVMKEAEGYEKN